MSQDDFHLGLRRRSTEFSQVVSPNIGPNPRRRNSMSLPSDHGGRVLPMVRIYQPPSPKQQTGYWYHVTTPQNFELMRQSGGMMPLTLQPWRGVGLDQATGRDNPVSWADQLRDYTRRIGMAQNLASSGTPLSVVEDLTGLLRRNMQQLAREGTNRENLYLSSDIGSSLDYMTHQPMRDDGAVLMRIPRSGTGGFVHDTQGGQQDYRSRGMVILSRHIEFAEIGPELIFEFTSMSDRDAKGDLGWQPMNPKKSQPVLFRWGPGSCASEARKRHDFGGPKRDPDGGGAGGGTSTPACSSEAP